MSPTQAERSLQQLPGFRFEFGPWELIPPLLEIVYSIYLFWIWSMSINHLKREIFFFSLFLLKVVPLPFRLFILSIYFELGPWASTLSPLEIVYSTYFFWILSMGFNPLQRKIVYCIYFLSSQSVSSHCLSQTCLRMARIYRQQSISFTNWSDFDGYLVQFLYGTEKNSKQVPKLLFPKMTFISTD